MVAFTTSAAPVLSNSFTISAGVGFSLSFSTNPSTPTTLGNTFGAIVVAKDVTGVETSVGFTGTVTLTLISTTGGVTISGTAAVAAVAGVATFSGLSVSTVGTYNLSAKATGLTSAVSTSFQITVSASPDQMVITAPSTANVGKGFTVTVAVYYNNLNPISVVKTVQLSRHASSTGTGTLTGDPITMSTSAGVATFTNVVYTNSGSLVLEATCTDCAPSFSQLSSAITVSIVGSTVILTLTKTMAYESSTLTYTLKLSTAPIGTATVSITSGNAGVTISNGGSFSFTSGDYGTEQTVTLTVGAGIVSTGTSLAVTISHTASSGTDPTFAAAQFIGCDQVTTAGALTINVITSNTTPKIFLYEADTTTASMSYVIVATSASSGGTYKMTPVLSITGATFNPSHVTISNGNTSGTIDLTLASSVSSQLGYVICTISHTIEITGTYSLDTYQVVPNPFVVTILTTSRTSGVVQSAFPVFNEGVGSYTLNLLSQPTDAVTITLSVSPDVLSLASNVFTFTTVNYATPQTVTMTTRASTVTLGKIYSTTISHTAISTDETYNGSIYFSRKQNLPVYILNACTAGQYANLPGSGTCTDCPAGYYCPIAYGDKIRCATGYYSSTTKSLVCTPCPAGYQCADPSIAPVACAAGTYATGTAITCTTCEAGWACPSQIESVPCPLGTYSAGGAADCTECPAGSYCFVTTKATACSAGYASANGAIRCSKCPPGFGCPTGVLTSLVACAAGTYSPGGTSNCLSCPSGHRCSPFDDLGVCPEGYYAVAGNCVLCPAGSMCTAGIKTACTPAYSFIGDSSCRTCPPGFECPSGVDPIPCPAGMTNAGGTSLVCAACATTNLYADGTCIACPAGMYCSGPALPLLCPFGTYSPGNLATCTACTPGHVCIYGSIIASSADSLCPKGFVCKTVGSATVPVPCPAGTENPVLGKTDDAVDCVTCADGFECQVGTAYKETSLCAPGSYCTGGAAHTCGSGKYNPSFGKAANAATDCIPAPAGYYAPDGAIYPIKCPEGKWCAGGLGAPVSCLAGTFNPNILATAITDCLPCPKGYYCLAGSSFPTPCGPGTYNSAAGGAAASACTQTTAGWASPVMAAIADMFEPCAPGHWCPAGSGFPDDPANECPVGTINNSYGKSTSTDCTNCLAGWSCPSTGTANSRIPPSNCSKGMHCPGGPNTGTKCAAGTYSNKVYLTASTECSDCPAGYYCLIGSIAPSPCMAGHYCPPKSSTSNAHPCSAGTYSNSNYLADQSECLTCPKGQYCIASSTCPTACAAGTYNSNYGGSSTASCLVCPAGYFCPEACVTPEPCGQGYYSASGKLAQTDCVLCPAGNYCPNQATANTDLTTFQCPAGLYCPAGTDHIPTNLLDRCPAGKYCVLAAPTPVDCPAGKMRTLPGAGASTDCEVVYGGYFGATTGQSAPTGECQPGYYCPPGSTSATQNSCPLKTFRSLPRGSAVTDCANCPAGFTCGLNTVTPTACTAGNYCPEKSDIPTPCPIGTFNPDTQRTVVADCLPCLPGQYCATTGLLTPTGPCSAGYYCKEGATTSTPVDGVTGNICPAGGYCGSGTVNSQICPIGKYNPFTGKSLPSDCISCPSGQFCAGINSIDPTKPTGDCIAGFYCTGGASTETQLTASPGYWSGPKASTQTACAAGTYNSMNAQSSCTSCPAGFYCPGTANTAPTICPQGKYCVAGSSAYADCPQGTYNPNTGAMSTSDCYPCDLGKACPSTGLVAVGSFCSAGYWCRSSANSVTPATSAGLYGSCPVGAYCPSGTSYPILCSPGTFNQNTGKSLPADCGPCTAGSYCETFGLSAVTAACYAGFYCPAGAKQYANSANICPSGSYCTAGVSAASPCNAGTFQASDGQSSCNDCPTGFFCGSGANDYISTTCQAGYYCLAKATTGTATPCPQGTYNPNSGSQTVTACIPCSPGKYCATAGLSAPSGPCSGGWVCIKSAIQAQPAIAAQGYECAVGTYCPAGSNLPLNCNGGKYCATAGLSSPTGNCLGGYYCIYNSSVSSPVDGVKGNQCLAGYYCVAGSVSMVPCPSGTFSTVVGSAASSNCGACTPGKYCQDSAMTAISGSCSAGWYCVAGSSQSTPSTGGCPAGSMCGVGVSVATSCAAGTYQSMTLQSTCTQCPAGYYCDGLSPTAPIDCLAGRYCLLGTIDKDTYKCPIGTYNPLTAMVSASACLICPPGKYCDVAGLSAPTGTCNPGYYCTGGAKTATPNTAGEGFLCPVGSICAAGSSVPQKCPPGKYCATTGLSAPTGDCTAGYVCILGSTSAAPATTTATGGPCPAGHYCPTASGYAIPCPLGQFNPDTLKTAVSDCQDCTAGYYCNQPGSSAVFGPCSPGYYCLTAQYTSKPSATLCPAGKYCPGSTGAGLPGTITPIDCPAGTYNKLKGQVVCFDCPPGFKCEGASSNLVACDAGYYCPGRSSNATKIKCVAGTYNPYTGRSACVSCPLGFYCPLGCITPIICTPSGYCPAGSTAPTLCSTGLWTDLAGMQSIVQCKPCPAGQYCVNGAKVANCQAGYYCSAGNYVANPTGVLTGVAVGYLCPVGHYCLVGSDLPTPCPYGKFTAGDGAGDVSLCRSCTEGFYCIPGDPTPYPCPIGAYCPTGSRTPTNCPSMTYSISVKAKDATTCQPCPAGYLCSDAGVGDYHSRPCSPSYFCPNQASALQPCPEGTWSIISNSAYCAPCPAGFMCGAKAMTAVPCDRGKYCPEGTGVIPKDCPKGVYCEYAAANPTLCPGGYYCPSANSTMTELSPLRCPLGYYCPSGSYEPVRCPDGTVYTKYSLRLNPAEACVSCGPGLYSTGDVLKCKNCYAGYACPNGASRPDPQSIESDGGFPCPAGYYCPEGTGDPLPCPKGTYNPNTNASDQSQCLPCALNTYSELEGQAGCFPCGANSYAAEGQSTCTCFGEFRTYMKRDGTCRCKPGYIFFKNGVTESEEDSKEPCVPKVLKLCDSGMVRTPDGSCKSENDCSAECAGGVGQRKPGLGICLCKDIPSLDDVCNDRCRASSPSVTLRSDGKFELKYPSSVLTEILDFQSTPGYLGRVTCFSDLNCNVTTANVTSTGVFTSSYVPTAFTSYASSLQHSPSSTAHRSLQALSGLQNPVYCLQLGQTMVFSISSQQHYPIYLKDSILNTNKDFDFSPFLELANFIKNGGAPVSNFAYTFVDSGKYVFADALNSNNMIIVSVMERGATCSQAMVRERSESTMTRVGVMVDSVPNTETEWAKFGFLLGTSMLLLVTVVGIYVFRKRKFVPKPQAKAAKKMDMDTGLIQRQVEDVLSAEIGVHNRLLEVDPAFFQVIYDKLIDNFHILASRLSDRSAEEQAKLTAMLDALRKVRDTITDTKRPETPAATQRMERNDKERRQSLFGAGLITNVDKEQMVERIHRDPRLEEEEKQALLKELEDDMNRLDAQLAENRVTGENNLRKRLEERARRKKDLIRRREELAGEENQIMADMQKQLKDAETLNREADRDFEKERRKAREAVIGPDAIALRKDLEQRIRDSPGREDELIADFDKQIDRMESRMDAEKKRQLEDALRRADERRAARRKKAAEKGKAANDLESQANLIRQEIRQVDEQLDMLDKMNETTTVVPQQTEGEDLTQHEEESVRKQFLMRQRDMDKEYHAKMDDLQRQKQRLIQTLATPDFQQDKQRLQADLERAEETLERMRKEQVEKQRQLLEARLLERKKRKDRKRAELHRDDANRLEVLERESDQKLVQLADILRYLPVSEKAEAARKLLAEKHDSEVVEIERHQQSEAAREYRMHIKRVMDAKVAATKALPEHLSSLSEAEQKANFNQLMMGLQSELQEDLQRRMRELQDQATKEMEALTARQSRELHDLLKSLEPDVSQEDLYRLEADFDKRRVELEDENAHRLESLQKQNEELVTRLKQKKEQLNEAVLQAQQLQEIEHAKRVLEDKHRREREALERAQNLTHEQVEILLARHRQEIEQLEQTLHEEQARHKEQLAARLAAKRSKKQKLLDLPEDLKTMAPSTAQLVSNWRKAQHQTLVEVDDPMLELLRRVERIEQIVQNVEQVQFEQLQKAFDGVLALHP